MSYAANIAIIALLCVCGAAMIFGTGAVWLMTFRGELRPKLLGYGLSIGLTVALVSVATLVIETGPSP